jgi:hypothetical protein
VDFDPGGGLDNHTSNGSADAFLSKFDSSGNFKWAHTWGGSNIDQGFGVVADGNGNAYATGQFQGIVDFDPGSGVDDHSNGDYGIFLNRFKPDGSW